MLRHGKEMNDSSESFLFFKKVGKILDYVILVMIFVVFVWMEFPNLESHYNVMRYEC